MTRVLVPLVFGEAYRTSVLASAGLWSTAFAIFFVRYWPVLTRRRVDGKPG